MAGPNGPTKTAYNDAETKQAKPQHVARARNSARKIAFHRRIAVNAPDKCDPFASKCTNSMYFTKIPHISNFRFADSFDAKSGKVKIGNQQFALKLDEFPGDVWHLSVASSELWDENHSLAQLTPPKKGVSSAKLSVDSKCRITLTGASGKAILNCAAEGSFGVMGRAAMWAFEYHHDQQFYGMGEKTFGTLELTHRRSRFWNTDALGDFNHAAWDNQPLDPYYVSIPYLIVRLGDEYVGILYENPYATFMDCGSDASFFGDQDENRRVIIGSEDGLPSLWVIYGPSLAELTCKLQKLVGPHQRPPLWALGYHQCQWGYKGEADIVRLDGLMVKHQIPNDGLWLDIDYMDGFRVFTYAKKHFPNGVASAVKKVAKNDRKVVPIIDPGVKLDPGYEVYDSGKAAGVYCQNPQGEDYIGFVWPGLTVFPDFSLKKARTWWAEYAKSFREQGFAGAWVDMNDPSTGGIDPMAMRFNKGKWPHEAFHNQYALGMQMATHEGFQAANPNERVFIVSRSGSTGTARYSAIWTGDNMSTRWYLRNAITCCVGLSLSGIPFNGPDAGGFAGDTTEPLITDWVRAGFLFPFFRIHSPGNHRLQEPWAFSKAGLKDMRHYIRLRYKLLPYLYNLFVVHNEQGHPILRPSLYHFDEAKASDDTFMVGPDLFQAPFLEEGKGRSARLPGGKFWFDARTGEWVKGKIALERNGIENPVFFRDGAIIPTLVGERTDNTKNLGEVEFHVFLRAGSTESVYTYDDGSTLDYNKGKQSRVLVTCSRKNGVVSISTEQLESGFGALDAEFVLYGEVSKVLVNGERAKVSRRKITWCGKPISVAVVKA